jgi:hypothetical protein
MAAKRTCRSIVAEYRSTYPHQVRLVSAEEWKRGASLHDLEGKRVVNWDGLLLYAWQPIDDSTPRLPLPP